MMNMLRMAFAAVLAGAIAPLSNFASMNAGSSERTGSQTERSAALFLQMMRVLNSPRCMNCHPATNFPRQGDDGHRHLMLVARGPDDSGAPSLQCQTCHRDENTNSGVPGAPGWQLAPRDMAWQGLSAGELCRTILDPKKGQQTPDTIVAHMQTPFVQWAWDPGVDLDGKKRNPPPIPSADFINLVREWVESGASCP
jgi:hypothetical protein